jgi:hypothetical protein
MALWSRCRRTSTFWIAVTRANGVVPGRWRCRIICGALMSGIVVGMREETSGNEAMEIETRLDFCGVGVLGRRRVRRLLMEIL